MNLMGFSFPRTGPQRDRIKLFQPLPQFGQQPPTPLDSFITAQPTPDTLPDTKASQLNNEGQRLLRQGDLDLAESAFSQALVHRFGGFNTMQLVLFDAFGNMAYLSPGQKAKDVQNHMAQLVAAAEGFDRYIALRQKTNVEPLGKAMKDRAVVPEAKRIYLVSVLLEFAELAYEHSPQKRDETVLDVTNSLLGLATIAFKKGPAEREAAKEYLWLGQNIWHLYDPATSPDLLHQMMMVRSQLEMLDGATGKPVDQKTGESFRESGGDTQKLLKLVGEGDDEPSSIMSVADAMRAGEILNDPVAQQRKREEALTREQIRKEIERWMQPRNRSPFRARLVVDNTKPPEGTEQGGSPEPPKGGPSAAGGSAADAGDRKKSGGNG